MNYKTPCKDCEDRVYGCHSTCDKYKAFQTELERIKHAKKDESDIYFVLWKERKKRFRTRKGVF